MASRGITSYSTEIVQYLLQRTTAIKTVYLFGGNKFHYLLESGMPEGTLINSETGCLAIQEKNPNYSLILFRGQLRITTTALLGTSGNEDILLSFLRITPNKPSSCLPNLK